MGYSTRKHFGGTIESFWPDDSETEFYISDGTSLYVIIETCKEKWLDVEFDNIQITSEYIHTDCLGYDCYDSGDYTCFIKIEYFKED
jgi:hypothetical protein